MKKLIGLLVLVAIAGAAYYGYSRFRSAREDAAPYEVEEMTDEGVAKALRSADLKERLDAVAQLDKLSPEIRKAALLDALDSDLAPARLTALTALRTEFAADPDFVERALEVAKDDPDPDVRETAFAALAEGGDPRVLTVAAEVLVSTDAPLAVKLRAARTLDALTGRETAGTLSEALDAAEEAADDLGMEWDDWLTEHQSDLRWNPESKRFE